MIERTQEEKEEMIRVNNERKKLGIVFLSDEELDIKCRLEK
jgi:hypothetical protein